MKIIGKILWLPVALLLTTPLLANRQDSTKYLQPTSAHIKEAKIIAQILDYYHYRQTELNDSLSSVIFNDFISTLDGNKNYFLQSDLQSFEKYRYELDDALKYGNLVAPFYIFNIYRKRMKSRIAYALAHVSDDFDYTLDETFTFDRKKAPYAEEITQLNDLWRKIIKDQALRLKLSGAEREKIVDVLTKRYRRFQNNAEKYNSNDVFETFMNAVTGAFDPHTNYFTPLNAENFEMQSKKSLEGIGAFLQQDNDFTKITDVRPGGPAFLSGQISKEDRIVGIAQGAEGEMIDVVGWRSDEVAGNIRGPKGTIVRLKLLPAGANLSAETKEVSLVRDKIKLDEAKASGNLIHYIENDVHYKIGVLTIPDFYLDAEEMQEDPENYTSTTNDVRRLIRELEAQGADGIMLDLRNNGGGALVEAISLTGLFLPGGSVVQVKNSREQIQQYYDEDKAMVYKGPLSVMVNRFSASASEILAGAIQDYKRGMIVGEQTYGKGTVQNVRNLKEFLRGSNEEKLGLLKFTIAKFYRVSGSSTQHKGVTPDIEYPAVFSAEAFGESSKPSALPWDKISAAQFVPLDNVNDRMLTSLRNGHKQQLKKDPLLIDLQYDIVEANKNRLKKEVSLNYEVRKQEQEEREQRRVARTKIEDRLQSEQDTASAPKADKTQDHFWDELKDAYLKESIRLLAQQIELTGQKSPK